MKKKLDSHVIFMSLTIILFMLVLLGYKLFRSELGTMETWRIIISLTGFTMFLSVPIAVLIVYAKQRADVIIRRKQVWIWLGYIVLVASQTIVIVGMEC